MPTMGEARYLPLQRVSGLHPGVRPPLPLGEQVHRQEESHSFLYLPGDDSNLHHLLHGGFLYLCEPVFNIKYRQPTLILSMADSNCPVPILFYTGNCYGPK